MNYILSDEIKVILKNRSTGDEIMQIKCNKTNVNIDLENRIIDINLSDNQEQIKL